jgi:hypothetical protein
MGSPQLGCGYPSSAWTSLTERTLVFYPVSLRLKYLFAYAIRTLVNRRVFTVYLFMENHVLSVGDIALETGLSRQRIWRLAVTGGIPAERANPGGKQYRFLESPKFATWRKDKAQASARPRAPRTYRIGQRRLKKIEKLWEILENGMPVSAQDKKAALVYWRCVKTLRRSQLRLQRLNSQAVPLVKLLRAQYEIQKQLSTTGAFAPGSWMAYLAVETLIELLPTFSETTPQTEQSSLNVSAQ